MTILIERPTTAVEGDLAEPISAEVLFAEARQRARRRRNFVILAIAVVFALVAAGAVVIVQPWARHPTIAQRHAPTFSTDSDGFPTAMVVWEAPTAYHANGIEVIDSTTGKTLRTLVKNTSGPWYRPQPANPLSYVQFGFDLTNDGRTLYFDSNSEIESVSTSGGPVSRIVSGGYPVVSPDGSMLAYRPGEAAQFGQFSIGPEFAVRNLRTGVTTMVTVPGVMSEQTVTLAWLPDSTRILVHASDQVQCRPALACLLPPTRPPGWSNSTQLLDTTTGAFTPVLAATSAALDESAAIQPQLDGAGAKGDLVRVSAVVSPTTWNSFTELGTLDVATGVVRWQYRLPADFTIRWRYPAGFPMDLDAVELPGQDSGDHFILESSDPSGLHRWSPAVSDKPAPVGHRARVLSFDTFWDIL